MYWVSAIVCSRETHLFRGNLRADGLGAEAYLKQGMLQYVSPCSIFSPPESAENWFQISCLRRCCTSNFQKV